MKQIKISFLDGGLFCQKLFLNLLKDEYELIEDLKNPDIIFYSMFGNEFKKYDCKKILVIGENSFPNFEECDYAISPHNIILNNRSCYIPFFVFNKEYKMLCENRKFELKINPFKRKFCSAVISNNHRADPIREQFMKKLHEKMHIDSIGKVFKTANINISNRPAWAENQDNEFTNPSKIDFISQYKFNLALENSKVDGYCTEKITDAFAANTIPIYFGDPNIKEEFNEKSFINISDFKNMDEAVDFIIEINNDEQKYLEMLNSSNIINKSYYQKLKDFLVQAIEGPIFEHRFFYQRRNYQ